jgi:hypothetical protein
MPNIGNDTSINEQLRHHQNYWVLIISSIIVFLVNLFIALFNPVTTYCIADSTTRDSARFIEIFVIIMFFFSVVLLFIKKGDVLVIFLSTTAIGLQFSLLGYIARVNKTEICNYISKRWAYLGIIVTLLGAIVNTGYLYFIYLTTHPKKMKQKIILQLVGVLVYILTVSVLFYLGFVVIMNY